MATLAKTISRVPFTFLLYLAACSGAVDDRSGDGADMNINIARSPLDVALGLEAERDSDLAAAEARAFKQELAVAECMAEHGFEYFPIEARYLVGKPDGLGSLDSQSQSNWVERYGFGITTTLFEQVEVPKGVIGTDYEPVNVDDANRANDDYLDTLEETDQRAYEKAFYGKEPTLADNLTRDEIDQIYEEWEPSGCFYENADFLEPLSPEVDALYSLIDEMERQAEADARIVAHRRQVEVCVERLGFPYLESPVEARRHFQPLLSEALTSSEDEGATGADALTGEQAMLLSDLQRDELEIAAVVVQCGGNPIGESKFELSVRYEYEEEFVSQYQDQIALVFADRNP